MVTPSNLYEALGLPTLEDVESDLARMREHFPEATTRLQKVDRWIEELGDRTGLPSYHDVFAGMEWLQDTLEGGEPKDDEPAESTSGDDEDDGLPWWTWMLGAGAVGYFIYKKLDHKVEISEDIGMDIPGFEIDGIPWTVERTRMPGPQMAARIADPMLHGGIAVPGPGSADVRISGRGALTVEHVVGACPMPHVTGPTLKIEFDAEVTGFADFEFPVDLDRDGTIDGILEVRQRAKVTAESEHSAVLDPKRPGRAKSSKEGELDVETDFEAPEVRYIPLDPSGDGESKDDKS